MAPRPVTPVGIAAALVRSVETRLDGADGGGSAVAPEVLADLARARDLLDGVEDYVARCTSPASPALQALETRTRAEAWGEHLEQEMLSGHVEGAFLRMLVAVTGATRVLEVGMFTGYSALAMAEALPVGVGARLVACEVDERAAQIAREAFATTPAGGVIDVRVGPAADTLRDLAAAGERFDLVFVDADKGGYATYLDLLLDGDLLAPRALLAVDNTLLQGEPWLPGEAGVNGAAIAAFNDRVAADERLEQVLLPVRDGVTLIRRVS
ncbi:O-methyltransferase [Nocardioides nanhaiensis]|uniref:Class I SAM-dependent methyltransferase n=1 Tax=Nocardioides nanhaiensis TaxID=1476871 RepID=A0ABP8X025_9ACTN